MRVASFNIRNFSVDSGGIRLYEIPYSKETFFAMLKHTRSQDPTYKRGGVGLGFTKDGKHMAIDSIEQFTTSKRNGRN